MDHETLREFDRRVSDWFVLLPYPHLFLRQTRHLLMVGPDEEAMHRRIKREMERMPCEVSYLETDPLRWRGDGPPYGDWEDACRWPFHTLVLSIRNLDLTMQDEDRRLLTDLLVLLDNPFRCRISVVATVSSRTIPFHSTLLKRFVDRAYSSADDDSWTRYAPGWQHVL